MRSTAHQQKKQAATEALFRQVSKRSLIILITNIRDDAADEFGPVLKLAQRRHIVLLASLRERVLTDTLEGAPQDHRGALAIAATHRYLWHRQHAHHRLRKAGVHCLDVDPHRLAARLVNRYLDIKGQGLL